MVNTLCVQLSTIFFVKGHHVVNGGQYVNQMARSVDYSAQLVNTALESNSFMSNHTTQQNGFHSMGFMV